MGRGCKGDGFYCVVAAVVSCGGFMATGGASMAVSTAWMRALGKLLALMRIFTGVPVNEGGTDGIRAVYYVVPEQGVPIQESVEVDGRGATGVASGSRRLTKRRRRRV